MPEKMRWACQQGSTDAIRCVIETVLPVPVPMYKLDVNLTPVTCVRTILERRLSRGN